MHTLCNSWQLTHVGWHVWVSLSNLFLYLLSLHLHSHIVFLCKRGTCGFSCCCLERMSVQLWNMRLMRLWRRQTTATIKLTRLIGLHFVANISLVRDTHMAVNLLRKDLARNAFMTRFVLFVSYKICTRFVSHADLAYGVTRCCLLQYAGSQSERADAWVSSQDGSSISNSVCCIMTVACQHVLLYPHPHVVVSDNHLLDVKTVNSVNREQLLSVHCCRQSGLGTLECGQSYTG